MPNPVHLIAVPERSDSLARALGRAHNLYSRWFNVCRRRSGHLWQNRFYSASLGRDHLLTALRYVDLSRVRAGLIGRGGDYRWSSAGTHDSGRDPSGLLDMGWAEICPCPQMRLSRFLLSRFLFDKAGGFAMPRLTRKGTK